MAKPILTAARLRELLHYDPETGIFIWRMVRRGRCAKGSVAGTMDPKGYIRVRLDGVVVFAHRLAWLYETGSWPKGQIDHINGIRNDNRIDNLRDASAAVNSQNRHVATRLNRSGLLGVTYRPVSGTWHAHIRVNGRALHIGAFKDPSDAHHAYLEMKRSLHSGCTI